MKKRLANFRFRNTCIRLKKVMLLAGVLAAFSFAFTDAVANNSSFAAFQQQQNTTVTGKVTDSLGHALPGVSVVVKDNPGLGTATDVNGLYVIQIPNNEITLVFTLVGYRTLEVPIAGQTQLDVIMGISTSTEDEVVVVGFGTQRRKEMVGSVITVKPSDLQVPASNLTTAFAGRIAGMIAYQRSGEPGMDDADFFIRGVTSFGIGKRDPLILIDMVELTRTDLARLRPDDIESFSVLRDANATAVYGARGANGVILVTTKRGREGKVQVNLRGEGSIYMPTQTVEFADPVMYMRMYNDAFTARNPFAETFYSQQKIDATAEGQNPLLYPANDWQSQMFKPYTFNHRYNLSVRGGGKVARYYVAGSYAQDHGNLRVDKRNNFNNNVNLKTYTLRSNVDVNLTKSTELLVRLTGNFDNYNGPRQGGAEMYNMVVRSNPVDFPAYYPVDQDHAHITHIMFGGLRNRGYLNPYAQMVSGYKEYDRSLMMAQLELKQDLSVITPGLNFHVLANVNKTSRYEVHRSYNPFYYDITYMDPRYNQYAIEVFNPDGGTEYLGFDNIADGRAQVSVFYSQAILNYTRTFNNVHSLTGMLVGLAQSTSTGTASQLQLTLPSRNLGVSARATYGYDSRYFAEVNFGYNGSERFDVKNRWGFFPSAGVAWTVSNEKFMEPIANVISLLKLRATYGQVGNDAIGDATDRFFYLSNVNMADANLGSRFGLIGGYIRPGVNVTRYANPFITWERATKANLGLELNLWNWLQLQADVYQEDRSNILMNRVDIPTIMGLSADVRANVGKSRGRGMDIALTADHNFNNGLYLQLLGNFTYATARFVAIEEPLYDNEYWLSQVGQKLDQPYGFIAERLFVDDAEVFNSPAQGFGAGLLAGDIKYKDVNRDGRISDLDMVPIGYPIRPEITYGVGFSTRYKSFDISTFFQGLGNTSFFIGGQTIERNDRITQKWYGTPAKVQPFVGGKQVLKVFADDYYSLQTPNEYALYPRLSDIDHANNMQSSTWWIRNGKFLRLKQAEIGYTLPARLTTPIGMERLRVYFNGTNLLTFSQFKLWDVEMGGNGLGYPNQRVFNLGINANF